jgi:antitoxin (DNA-binding transcriptional repressor) of toxin-antitoxin stability system
MVMKMVNIAEAKTQLSDLLDQVAAGAQVIICKRNQPIAELRAVAAARTTARPLGLAAGAVTIPATFFEPLPDEVLEAFEPHEVGSRESVSRVAESRAAFGPTKKLRRPGGTRR